MPDDRLSCLLDERFEPQRQIPSPACTHLLARFHISSPLPAATFQIGDKHYELLVSYAVGV
jgi:hypothetical protein